MSDNVGAGVGIFTDGEVTDRGDGVREGESVFSMRSGWNCRL